MRLTSSGILKSGYPKRVQITHKRRINRRGFRCQHNSRRKHLNGLKMGSMAKKKLPPEVVEYFRKQGVKGGKLSGAARMEKLTPEQRSAIAKNAVEAREAKRAASKKNA